ncbi:ABC transporter permease [Paenibacillus sanguinis]|uniref:ABC transporter permease n=1 Tax=Paenibacillus sanguinis TaxID=225906 RepID=UPI0003703167|nr:ABC transporter permease subunit [Paenibacillus sanguinis]
MSRSIISLSQRGLSLLLLCLIWQLLALRMEPFILPGPLDTLRASIAYLGEGDFYYAVCRTLLKLVVGMLGVLLVGGGLGLVIGLRPRWKPYVEPVIDMMQSVPPIAWLGIAIIWFGLTDMPSIFIIVLSTIPVLFTNLYEGFLDIDAKLIRMAQVFNVPRRKVLLQIVLPSLSSYLRAGMITSAGLGWKLAVMAELLTSSQGIGGLLSEARTNLDTGKVFALALFMALFWNIIKWLMTGIFRNKARGVAHSNK